MSEDTLKRIADALELLALSRALGCFRYESDIRVELSAEVKARAEAYIRRPVVPLNRRA